MIFKDKISKKDAEHIKAVSEGNINNATAFFIARYVSPAIKKYYYVVQKIMRKALNPLMATEANSLMIMLNTAEVGLESALKKVYNSFLRVAYSDKVFRKIGVTNPLAKRSILNTTIAKFQEQIKDSLSRMNAEAVSTFRSVQTDLMRESARLDALEKAGSILKKKRPEIFEEFKTRLLKKNKKLSTYIDEGPFVTYKNGAKHALDEYAEMSVKTSVLNVDRNAVELQEAIHNRRVSEYYRRDKTPYKTNVRRQVCAEILSKKFHGESLIAHDESAAQIFGIMTLDEAKGRGAFGPNCKHSIKALSKKNQNRVDTLLTISEKEAV